MIVDGQKYFILNTKGTSYAMRVTPSGHVEHMYYGKKIRVAHNLGGLFERQEFIVGNNNSYSPEYPYLTLNNLCMEYSAEGKGDNREAMIVVETPDGKRTNDFVFERAVIDNIKEPLPGMPSSYSDAFNVEAPNSYLANNNHLAIILTEKNLNLTLTLDYYIFEEENVIARSTRLRNNSGQVVYIKQLYSAQLDL